MVSACHEGFTMLAENYKKYAATRSDNNLSVSLNEFLRENPTPMCMTDEEYAQHEYKMDGFNDELSTAQIASEVTLITALAMAGQIEEKYLDEYEALKAATFMCYNTAYCIKANYAITGSFLLEPTDLYILCLNGALQYLTQGDQWYNG